MLGNIAKLFLSARQPAILSALSPILEIALKARNIAAEIAVSAMTTSRPFHATGMPRARTKDVLIIHSPLTPAKLTIHLLLRIV